MIGSACRAVASVSAMVLAAVLATGCDRAPTYSRETPDDVIRSAVEMVKNGDTRRLPELIHADSPAMRKTLDELGVLLGRMQALSEAAAKAYPTELAALRERARAAAEKEAKSGGAGLLEVFGGGGGRRRNGPPSEAEQDRFREAINQLFADPFAWLEGNAGRLSTLPITDDSATVLLDGEPIIPIVGLPLQLEDGAWSVRLPTQLPGVAEAMPQTAAQWGILRQVIKVADNAVAEMTADIQAGRGGGLDQLAERAQQKMIFPAMIAFAAYGKEMDVRQRTQRRQSQFTAREREWVKARAAREETTEDEAVSPILRKAWAGLAPAELEAAVRKNRPGGIDKLKDGEFEDLLGGWLQRAGLTGVELSGPLSPGAVDGAVAAWEGRRGNNKP